MIPEMFLVVIVTQYLLVNDGIVVVQLLSLVVIVSPNISNSTSRFCGTLATHLNSAVPLSVALVSLGACVMVVSPLLPVRWKNCAN